MDTWSEIITAVLCALFIICVFVFNSLGIYELQVASLFGAVILFLRYTHLTLVKFVDGKFRCYGCDEVFYKDKNVVVETKNIKWRDKMMEHKKYSCVQCFGNNPINRYYLREWVEKISSPSYKLNKIDKEILKQVHDKIHVKMDVNIGIN